MSRAHDRSVAARLVAMYAEEAAASAAGECPIRTRLVQPPSDTVGFAPVACIRGMW
jgi:hypothetical protein